MEKYSANPINVDTYEYFWANEMKKQYGLPHCVGEIRKIWLKYSEMKGVRWLGASDYSIEGAFDVKLKVIE